MFILTDKRLASIKQDYERMLEVNPRPRPWGEYLRLVIKEIEYHSTQAEKNNHAVI